MHRAAYRPGSGKPGHKRPDAFLRLPEQNPRGQWRTRRSPAAGSHRAGSDRKSAAEGGVNAHTAVAVALLPLLGGKENLVTIDNCTTRLRLEVADSSKVNDAEIKKIAAGIIKKGNAVQVIIGPHVEFVATELKKLV